MNGYRYLSEKNEEKGEVKLHGSSFCEWGSCCMKTLKCEYNNFCMAVLYASNSWQSIVKSPQWLTMCAFASMNSRMITNTDILIQGKN